MPNDLLTTGQERYVYDIREGINFITQKILAFKLLLGIGFYALGFSFFGTFVNTYFTLYLGIQGLEQNEQGLYVAFTLGAGAILYMIGALLGGTFSDDLRTRLGPRIPLIIVSSVLAGFLMIFADPLLSVLGNGLPAYFLVFAGIFFLLGTSASPWNALVSDLLSKERRAWSALVTASLTTIGVGAGILVIAPLIKNAQNTSLIWIICGLVLIISTIVSAILIPKVNPDFEPDATLPDLLKSPQYLFSFGKGDFSQMFWISLLWGVASTTLSSFFAFYVRSSLGFPENDLTLFMIITAATGLVVAIPAGFLCNFLGKANTGILASLTMALFFLILFLIPGYNGMILSSIMGGIAGMLLTTVGVALPADLMPEGKEGQFWSFILISRQVSAPLALALGGILIYAFNNFILLFVINAGLMVIAAVGMLFIGYERLSLEDYLRFHRRFLRARKRKTIRERN
ncbi:MAG: MFS transporter [Candidatus Hodarchaeota archaeon]